MSVHGGGGTPDYGAHPASLSMFILEAAFYSHRSAVVARHVRASSTASRSCSFVLAGVRRRLGARMCWRRWTTCTRSCSHGNVGELPFISPFLLDRMPSEYWQTNCWIGASFMTRQDCLDRKAIGVDRIMWGSDFPHAEGTFPYTAEALAHTFVGVR